MSADDLAAFLTARYDEAEARARGIEDNSEPWPGQWEADGNRAVRTYNGHVLAYAQGGDFKPGFAAYVADVDPAHRLADITLKRAILAGHARVKSHDGGHGCRVCDWDSHCEMVSGSDEWCTTVRQLGTEFNGHPGYKEDWKP